MSVCRVERVHTSVQPYPDIQYNAHKAANSQLLESTGPGSDPTHLVVIVDLPNSSRIEELYCQPAFENSCLECVIGTYFQQ